MDSKDRTLIVAGIAQEVNAARNPVAKPRLKRVPVMKQVVDILDKSVPTTPEKKQKKGLKYDPITPTIYDDNSKCPRCGNATERVKLRAEGLSEMVGSFYKRNEAQYCTNCKLVMPRLEKGE